MLYNIGYHQLIKVSPLHTSNLLKTPGFSCSKKFENKYKNAFAEYNWKVAITKQIAINHCVIDY